MPTPDDVIDIEAQRLPVAPSLERVCWYQHLFQSERGRAGLRENRVAIARMLWREWSPNWAFSEATSSGPRRPSTTDFGDVVIHKYRVMHDREPGDSTLQALEDRLAERPPITVPAVTIDGSQDPLKPGGNSDHAALFTGRHDHWMLDAGCWMLEAGYNVPQEAPGAFAKAVLQVRGWQS